MSPRPPRGRRPKAWTHQQKRKLIRLYTLTTLTNAEILAVLGGEGFSLSERHVLMKLREFYSKDYIDDLYRLRPRNEAVMRSRFNSMRRYRSCRVSKAARYSRVKFHSQTVSSRPNSVASDFDDSFRSLPNQRSRSTGSIFEQGCNAFRSYHVPITPDLQIHLSKRTLQDSQPTHSALLMLDGSTSSNQILLALPEPEPGRPRQNCSFCRQPTNEFPECTHQLSCGHMCHDACLSEILQWSSSPILKRCPTCNAVLILDSKSGIDPRKLMPALKRELNDNDVVKCPSPTKVSVTSSANEDGEILKADSSTDSSSLTEQGNSEDGHDSIRQRLQNRPPSYIEQVNSIVRLSLSESSRSSSSLSRVASSLQWTVSSRSSWMSMSSKSTSIGSAQTSLQSLDEQPRQGLLYSSRRMFYKVAGPLVKGERDIWNEIVYEGQLLPAPESRPKYPETNLFDRACPGILDPFDQSCNHCGYSFGWYHSNDNHRDVDDLSNTKLHYAAAIGGATLSLTDIRLLVNQGVDIAARNRSGQTFMHVLKTKLFIQGQGLGGYIELLQFLSRLNFSFSQRDLHGRTIAHHICKEGVLFSAAVADNSISQIFQILRILNTDMNTLDNHGFNAGDEFLRSAKNAYLFRLPKISAMKLLENALAILRRPGLLQTNFRESLANPDWEPRAWIKWLQDTNLMDWIDIHGDTPLTALLKNRRSENQQATLANTIPKLVQLGVEVNMRDRKGHTAIAIAVIRGSLSCVQALLDSGASVDVVNYNGRDIVSMASWRMKMAKQEGKTGCYARILACMNLIMDIQSGESHN